MDIYVDIVVVENALINLFLLLLTAKLLRVEYRVAGLYFAAILGGIYTLVIFMSISFLTTLFMKIIVASLMIIISLKVKNTINVFKSIIIFFILSFLLSGLCFAIALSQSSYVVGHAVQIDNYSIKWIILSLMLMYIVLTRIADYLRDRALVKNLSYDIYINLGEKTLLLKGFLDTGNELREPVTNLPCIIVENKFLSDINIDDSEKYAINFKTIAESGKLYGFIGKEIRIRNYNEKEWININAIICGCNNKLSIEDEYQVLLSRGVI